MQLYRLAPAPCLTASCLMLDIRLICQDFRAFGIWFCWTIRKSTRACAPKGAFTGFDIHEHSLASYCLSARRWRVVVVERLRSGGLSLSRLSGDGQNRAGGGAWRGDAIRSLRFCDRLTHFYFYFYLHFHLYSHRYLPAISDHASLFPTCSIACSISRCGPPCRLTDRIGDRRIVGGMFERE